MVMVGPCWLCCQDVIMLIGQDGRCIQVPCQFGDVAFNKWKQVENKGEGQLVLGF